jgi:hypothetical protein
MSAPVNPADPPMAEPGKRPSGGDVGGTRATTQSGVADWAQRSTERSEQPPSDPVGSAGAAGKPAEAGAGRKAQADDEDEWRHDPVAPVDEPNPLRSLGKAVGDIVTGSDRDTAVPPKR